MKYFKLTLFSFVIALSLSVVCVFAIDGYAGVASVQLPSFKGEAKILSATKTEEGAQYYKNAGTIDNLTGNQVSIKVRTCGTSGMGSGLYTGYIQLSPQQRGTWGNSAVNIFNGNYDLYARRVTNSLAKSTHSGVWWLNPSLLPPE